jgi:hypothetical protein
MLVRLHDRHGVLSCDDQSAWLVENGERSTLASHSVQQSIWKAQRATKGSFEESMECSFRKRTNWMAEELGEMMVRLLLRPESRDS